MPGEADGRLSQDIAHPTGKSSHPGGALPGSSSHDEPAHGTRETASTASRHPANYPPDEQMLEAHLAGDPSAFPELVRRYQRELYQFLSRFMGDRTAAEDIFQEAFLQVHQSAAQFDPQRRFRPWLFTIAANKARDYMRSQGRRPTSSLQGQLKPGEADSAQFVDLMQSAQHLPEEILADKEIQELVYRTVMEMPDHLREILLLSYFNQFPYKQIADMLDIPLGTVKSRLHGAVAFFANRWKSLNPPQNRS